MNERLRQGARELAQESLRRLPLKTSLLRFAASLPPASKRQTLTRLFGFLGEQVPDGAGILLETNLGIDSPRRLRLPITSSRQLLYGIPAHILSERGALLVARRLLQASQTFLDVGANEGLFTLCLAAWHPDRTFLCLEPLPELCTRLVHVLEENPWIRGHALQCAASDTTGRATFFEDIDSALMGSLVDGYGCSHRLRRIEVETTTLDALFASQSLDPALTLVKVDVENAEGKVLAGAAQVLPRLRFLLLELLGPARGAGILDQLIAAGFDAYYINDLRLERMMREDHRYTAPQWNFLFCRDTTPEDLRRLVEPDLSVVI